MAVILKKPAMALYTASIVLLSALSGVNGDATVSPSSATLPVQSVALDIFYSLNSMSGSATVQPLYASIGLGESINTINGIKISGDLRLATAFNYTDIQSSQVVYISCDPNSNTSNTDASYVVNFVAASRPQAIVLYSLTQASCAISGDLGFSSVVTMTSVTDSTVLRNFIASASSVNISPSATIATLASASTTAAAASTSTSGPTTAVAMSILYSVTGLITLLFIAIIATGAIRAHRHPERYGPRNGYQGRPRQSRAKGLARAMLETLPIVKFGDEEPAKPVITGSEIEMEDGTHHTVAAIAEDGQSESKATKASPSAVEETESVEATGSQIGTTSEHSKEESSEALGCSICTEDFAKGDDVRVLPCNHKYHPACVDPWLLNVSGTCPLCRVDLRPTATNDSATANNDLAPPLGEATDGQGRQSSVSSGRVDVAALRAVPAADRLAALRALRAERRQQQRDVLAQRGIPDPDAVPEAEADRSRRNGLTMRLKEKFRVRTHRAGSVAVVGNGEGSSGATAPAAAPPEAGLRRT